MRNTFMVVVLLISATAMGFAQVDTGSLVGDREGSERCSALERIRECNQHRYRCPDWSQDRR